MKIGEVAAAATVSVRALRYYEEQGLLRSERTTGGQRWYDEDAVDRVLWIQRMFAAGLGSKAVRQLLPCVYTRHATPDVVARLVAERDRLDAQLVELSATRARLDEMVIRATDSAGR